MAQDLMMALGLMLIIEGLLPGINPGGWKSMLSQVGKLDEKTIRVGGVVAMATGALIFHFAR